MIELGVHHNGYCNMPELKNFVKVNVVIDVSTDAIQTIVMNAKKKAGPDEKGFFRVDTADKVGEMISRFLDENDFEAYVKNPDKY